MRRTIYVICTLLALISCEIRFDLEIPEEDSKLFVFCLPGSWDSTAVIIDIARFAGDDISLDISKADIDICINGERQEVHFQPDYKLAYMPYDHSIPEDTYYITRKILPGDEVSLSVSYPGLESVSAVTKVPDAPIDADFRIENLSYDKNEFSSKANFIFEYTDLSDDTYYAAVFRERQYKFNATGYIENNGEVIRDTTETVWWEPKNMSHVYDPFQSGQEFNYTSFNNNNGLVFWKNSDALDKDGRKTVFFGTYIKHDVIYNDSEWWHEYLDLSYEATIYRISEELYRYYYTNLLLHEKGLNYWGLSRGNASFSNIKNGFGILGGMAGTVLTADVD